MLTIYMPGNRNSSRNKRRLRSLAYAVAGVLIITAELIAYHSNWWYLAAVIQAWWMWAAFGWLDKNPRR